MKDKGVGFPHPPSAKKKFAGCFGCGQENPIGLKLEVHWDGEAARAEFIPGEFHQGWPDTVHGGIIFSLLDEVMTYVPYFEGVVCLTARGEARFRRPVRVMAALWRASRVGSTQSNRSTPRETQLTRSTGVPTPIK